MLLVLPVISHCQISLNASMAPNVNSMMIYYDANVPTPPFTFSKSGTTNTWDFTSITPVPGADDTVYFVEPSSLIGGNSFPTATFGTYETGDQSITMVEVDANSMSFLGLIGDPVGIGVNSPVIANPPAVSMNFPYTYGSVVNSNTSIEVITTGIAIGQPGIDSVHYKSSFELNAMVIASGDMVLPSGTLSALLERQINTTIDTAWIKAATTGNQWVIAPNFPTTSMDSSFYWYSDQSLQQYAHALYDDTGLHDVNYFKSMLTTGIAKNLASSQNVKVYPNPVNDFLGIQGLNLPSSSEWKVYNLTGQQIMLGTSDLNQLNMRSLKAGSYLLQLSSSTGEQFQVRFIKN